MKYHVYIFQDKDSRYHYQSSKVRNFLFRSYEWYDNRFDIDTFSYRSWNAMPDKLMQ